MSRGIHGIRKLLDGNEEFPPSEDLWNQIVYLAKQPTKKNLQEHMIAETNTYKPSLPEPDLARFFYQGEYYFLDSHNQIYQTDPGNPLVGNLVGHIDLDKNTRTYQVTINKKVIHSIPGHQVKPREIHKRTYYLDADRKVYQGLHPDHPYLYQIGTLNKEGKIELE